MRHYYAIEYVDPAALTTDVGARNGKYYTFRGRCDRDGWVMQRPDRRLPIPATDPELRRMRRRGAITTIGGDA